MVWLVRLSDGKILGPLSTEEVLREIGRGEFSGEEMLSEYPSGQWKPIAQDPHLYDELLKALEDERRQIELSPEDLADMTGDDNQDSELEEFCQKQPIAALPSSCQEEVQGDVIDLKKKDDIKKQSKKKNFVVPVVLCLAAFVILFFGLEEKPDKKLGLNLMAPRENQPQISADQARQKSQKALKYFLLDTQFGYSKAQNELVQVIEGTQSNVDAYSLLCMVYSELWPYVKPNAENLRVISKTTQKATTLDPTGVKGSTCRVVKLILKGEYSKAKLVIEDILNKFGSSSEVPTNFYYFKALVLANERDNETALGYLNSAQKLWPTWLRPYSLEADLMIRSRRYHEGFKRLHEIIRSNPHHMEARIRLGRLEYSFYKRREQAKTILMDALKINDKANNTLMSQAYLTLAEIFLQENRKDKALEFAQKSYEKNSSNRVAKSIITELGGEDKMKNESFNDQQLVYQGDQFVRSGDCNAAQAHYKSAYENNPQNGMAAMKAAKCLWRLSFSLEAIDWLNKAILADPNLIEAYIYLADYYSQRYNYLAAMQSLSKAQEKVPRSYEIYRGYALIEKRRGNYQGVINFSKQALNLYMADVGSLILISEAYMKTGNFQESYSAATKAIEIDGSNKKAQINYGKSLFGIQGADASISYLSDLVSNFPVVIEYRLALGDILMDDERYSRAAEVYKQVSLIEEKSKKAFLGMGHAFKFQQKFSQSLDAFLQAAILDPSDPEALFQAGLIYLNSSKLQDARNQFLRVVKINERFPWVHYYLGQIDLKMKNPRGALRRAEEEKKINPRSPASYLLSAEAYTALGKYSLCGREYQKAIQMSSQGSGTYVKLARCYRHAGSMDVAESMLNQAKELESGNPDVYRELGAIYESRGDIRFAYEAYSKYLALAPNAPDAAQIRMRMRNF